MNEFRHPYLFTDKFKRHYLTDHITKDKELRADMIEQFQDFFMNIEDPDITLERRRDLLDMLDVYCSQNNLPNYQQLRNKPAYILIEAARRIFSRQENKFIPMSIFLERIVSARVSRYSDILQDQFGAVKISNLWKYCEENILDPNDKSYIKELIEIAGLYLDNIIFTNYDSLKAPEIEIVAYLQNELSVLNRWKGSNPTLRELIQYFEISLSHILSENSPNDFKRVFTEDNIQKIKNKLKSDLLPINPRGYNDIIKLLNKYDSKTRINEIEDKYETFQGWMDIRNRKIYGDSDTNHPKVWNKPKFQEMIRTLLFSRQGGYITIENDEEVYHVFDGFTGEIFTWKKLTLTPHKDLQSGEVVLIATNEEGIEVAVIHHIDFNKENNRLDNYLWIRRENHKTNLNTDAKREYIALGKIASLAFEYGFAPRFWSHEAQLQFYEAKRTNGGSFPSGDSIMIVDDPRDQLDLDHFLGND